MIRLKLRHKAEDNHQTLGLMDVYKNGIWQFTLSTVELAWKDNASNVSRIWEGNYTCRHWNSKKHPDTLILEPTEPRTGILIHIANFSRELLGCIAVGLTHTDIDKDGLRDVKYSTEAMNKLRDITEHETYILLEIVSEL